MRRIVFVARIVLVAYSGTWEAAKTRSQLTPASCSRAIPLPITFALSPPIFEFLFGL